MSRGTESATGASSITPNDTTQITKACRGVYVGTAGNLAVTMADGSSVTFVGVQAGSILPIKVKIIKDTGTTASDIVVLG